MVYKKYIYKNGQRFGPYYYESYRDGNTVKKRYIGTSLPSEPEKSIQEKEKPKGTILIIVGDHVSSLYNEVKLSVKQRMRFEIPIIIAGLPESLLTAYQDYANRRASQYVWKLLKRSET